MGKESKLNTEQLNRKCGTIMLPLMGPETREPEGQGGNRAIGESGKEVADDLVYQ